MTLDIKSPQLEVFNELLTLSRGLGYKSYDYLPDSSAVLPFVYVGEQFSSDIANKSTIHGNIQHTIHVYGNHRQRKQVMEIVGNLRYKMRELTQTQNFNLTVINMNDQTLIDNSNPTTLIHGMLEVEFSFN